MAHRATTHISLCLIASLIACLSACGEASVSLEEPASDAEGRFEESQPIGGSGGPDVISGVPVAPGAPDNSYAGQVATGMCTWLVGCCTALEQEDFVAVITAGDTQADTYALTLKLRDEPNVCRDLVKGYLLDAWRDASSAVATGRAVYNEGAQDACLMLYEDTSCMGQDIGDLSYAAHPCNPSTLVDGLVESGGLCTQDFECISGNYCEVPMGSDFGACRSWAAKGAPCNDDEACGPSAYCGAAGDFGVCASASAQLAPYCNLHVDCAPGEYCATATHTCVPALGEGSICQANPYCASSFCALETSQTCEETRGLNELCSSDAACGEEGYCDDAPPDIERCIALTQLGEGERCDLGAAVCGEGLLCEEGLCVPRSSMGGPCANNHYCPSNGWCDEGTCAPQAPIGGLCEDDAQCVGIGWCSAGECVARVEVGLSCDITTRCIAGAFCDMPDGVLGTCQLLPSAGSNCANGQCGEGLGCITYVGICAAKLSSGSNCDRSAMCNAEQRCASAGLSSDVCQAPSIVSTGESCASNETTCATGLYCSAGVCVAYAVSGEACSADEACVAGTSCVLGICKTYGGAFANCDTHEDCANGLFCDLGVQQCAPQKTLDQGCSLDVECQGTLYCNTTSFTCAWKKNSGETCNKEGECQEGLYCNIANSCAARLGVGQTCNVDAACFEGLACIGGLCIGPAATGMVCDPVMGCAEGATCNPQTNLCEALGTSGVTCDTDANCVPELFCGALSPTCIDRGDEGAACDTSEGCLPDLSCRVAGLCRSRSGIGAGCVPGQSQCVDGALCDPSGVCQALSADRGIGEPCGDHAQCQTKRCESGICVGICLGAF